MRYSTAGDSHGESLVGIIEGVPSGLKVDKAFIDGLLSARQEAFGRGERMKLSLDKAIILSGLNNGVTTGAPIAILIKNGNVGSPKFDFFRPGHVDYAASVKYKLAPNIGAERASARETAMRTALGAIALTFISELGISIESEVVSVGGSGDFENAVSEAKNAGDTLGGKIKLVIKGLIPGIGSYISPEKRLDSVLGGALFSIPAVKAVEIGLGTGYGDVTGRECADEFVTEGGIVKRTSNNCGGIEGGISNGEDLIFYLTLKPIPSIAGLRTIYANGEPTVTQKVRGDVCAVGAASVVARAVAALTLSAAILDCLGGDTMDEVKERFGKKAKEKLCKK